VCDRFRTSGNRRPHADLERSIDTIDRAALCVEDVFLADHLAIAAEDPRIKRLRKIVKWTGLSGAYSEFPRRVDSIRRSTAGDPRRVVDKTGSRPCGSYSSK
jgi:hypothetical protein